MNIEIINTKELTLDEAMAYQNELYFVYLNNKGVACMSPLYGGKLDFLPEIEDKALIRINDGEIKPEKDEKYDKSVRSYERRTYKFDGNDEHEIVFVEGRPDGTIRVNFKDKENAELYLKYIRDFFYKSTTGADWLTVSTIYKELKLVNWKAEDCDDWAWPTIDNGTCRYISEVAKTKNRNKMYGFTLKAPQKLYGQKA